MIKITIKKALPAPQRLANTMMTFSLTLASSSLLLIALSSLSAAALAAPPVTNFEYDANGNLTAVATDNSGNAASNTTSSAPIQLTVTAHVAQVYYIHTDQLNTPRLITNAANTKVWEWNNDDPFANNHAPSRAIKLNKQTLKLHA